MAHADQVGRRWGHGEAKSQVCFAAFEVDESVTDDELKLQLRVLRVQRAKERQEDRARAAHRRDAERALHFACPDAMRERTGGAFHSRCSFRDLLAIAGQRAAAAMPMDERHAEGLFELVEAPENAGVRALELACGACHRALRGDGAKTAQVIPIEVGERTRLCIRHAV